MTKNQKKFIQDCRVWANYVDSLLSSKQNREAAHVHLEHATQAPPQDLHKYLISKFAKLEFGSGNPERGRTLFEILLATFEKKSNMYNMFLDGEIKCWSEEGDREEDVKTLFKRAPAEKASTHQAKTLCGK